MVVRQSSSVIFKPLEIAAVAQKVLAGADNNDNSRGLVRAIEAQNAMAGLRPEQHFCQNFGSAGWGSTGFEPPLVEIFAIPTNAVKPCADIKASRDYPTLRTGIKFNVTNADIVRCKVSLIGDIGTLTKTIDFVAADNGTEKTDVFDMSLVGYGWVFVQMEIQTFAGTGTNHELRMWRLFGLKVTGAFPLPGDD